MTPKAGGVEEPHAHDGLVHALPRGVVHPGSRHPIRQRYRGTSRFCLVMIGRR